MMMMMMMIMMMMMAAAARSRGWGDTTRHTTHSHGTAGGQCQPYSSQLASAAQQISTQLAWGRAPSHQRPTHARTHARTGTAASWGRRGGRGPCRCARTGCARWCPSPACPWRTGTCCGATGCGVGRGSGPSRRLHTHTGARIIMMTDDDDVW